MGARVSRLPNGANGLLTETWGAMGKTEIGTWSEDRFGHWKVTILWVPSGTRSFPDHRGFILMVEIRGDPTFTAHDDDNIIEAAKRATPAGQTSLTRFA